MSTNLLAIPNPGLLATSLTQALQSALAFRRAPGVRALGAPRAHVLHARALSRHRPRRVPCLAPARLLNHAMHSPTHQYPPSTPWCPTAPPWRHAGVGSGLCHGRRRPSHPRAPAAPWEQPEPIHKPSARTRRRHVVLQLQNSGRRRSYPRPSREPALLHYKRRPRAPPSTQATSGLPPSAPLAAD